MNAPPTLADVVRLARGLGAVHHKIAHLGAEALGGGVQRARDRARYAGIERHINRAT
jgi:hypothetical protein